MGLCCEREGREASHPLLIVLQHVLFCSMYTWSESYKCVVLSLSLGSDGISSRQLWPLCVSSKSSFSDVCVFLSVFQGVRWRSDSKVHLLHNEHVFRVLSDKVVGEPVHEDGLCCRYRHGEVHPQLVSGSSHQPPLRRRLR